MTVLQPGELLTAIRIPGTWAGAQFYVEKVADRKVWDFPLLNVASAMKTSGQTIESMRIAVNAAAAPGRCGSRPSNASSPASRATRKRRPPPVSSP